MHKYELMFIVRPDIDEDGLKATREKLQTVLTERDGEMLDVNDMGKRRLAYTIKDKNRDGVKYREGFYTVYTFQSSTDSLNELERVMNIDDNVIRYLTINLDEK